jgi:methyl-accepting chemotaxis protein
LHWICTKWPQTNTKRIQTDNQQIQTNNKQIKRWFERGEPASNGRLLIQGVCVMRNVKPNRSTEIDPILEMDIGTNIHELARANDVSRQAEIIGDEIATNSLGPFLRRVSDASRREIKHLVNALQTLDKKLQTDGDRIQRDIEEYTELSQHVMQLTTIIADSVKKLPNSPSIS